MNTQISLFTAAALAVAGAGWSTAWGQQAEQQRAEQEYERTVRTERDGVAAYRDTLTEPQRELEIDEGEAGNIRGTLSTATEAALTEGQLRSLAQRFTSSDEARFADAFDGDQPELDRLVQQLRDSWQQRYGQDFSIDDREAVYSLQVMQMQRGVTEQAILAHGRMQPGEQPVEQPLNEAQQQELIHQDNVVTVILPATDPLPELHIALVNEGVVFDAWRIDVPLHVDPQTIQTNLQQNLSKALERQAEWPQDVNEAYRMATHIVLLSVLDLQHDEDAQPAGAELRLEVGEPQDQPQ